MTGNEFSDRSPSPNEQSSPNECLTRRRLLALGGVAVGSATLAGCGYRPGGGDIRWEEGIGTGNYQPDDLLASGETVFAVNRSVRGFDFDTEEWGTSADIAAYDADSGGPVWEESTPPCGRPATDGGRLYVGHEDGGLVALGSGGEQLWETDLDGFPRTVAVGGKRVYALTDSGDLHGFGTDDDGERLWQTALGAGDGGPGERATLTAAPNGVVVHYRRDATGSTVAAFRKDGERRWTAESVGDPNGRPAFDAETGTAFVAADRTLLALSLADGTERWSETVSGVRESPIVGDGRLYHAGDDALYARNPEDGEVLWRFTPAEWRGLSSGVAVGDERAFVGGHDALYAVSASDGSVDWQVEGERVTGGPLVAGGTVVVSTEDGYLRGHHRG